jgi:archaeal flagellar protein FlaJ
MKIKIRNPFAKSKKKSGGVEEIEDVIEHDTGTMTQQLRSSPSETTDQESNKKKTRKPLLGFTGKKKVAPKSDGDKNQEIDDTKVRERNTLERFAYSTLSRRLPGFSEFRESYGQSGISIIFEAYVSYGVLLCGIAALAAFLVSLPLEVKLLPRASLPFSILASLVLAALVFGTALVSWLYYPLLKRRTYKSKLENQLAYSFGILGVLASAGMNMDRLFERIATAESNPVLADLARRFLRNIRVFGLDTQTALEEVAEHSPSETFAKMLGSIAVAQKTTGSIHDLVMFESSRLLQEKKDKLHKTIGSLAVMAELYITLVVVGPIIFIVMMAIFVLLPSSKNLPNPILIINLIVFLGIPVLSVMFILLLDSVVSKA